MSKVFKFSDVSADGISLGAPKNLDNGGKIIGIYFKGSPLLIQTPNMTSMFGLSNYEGNEKYTIDISLRKDTEEISTFINLIESIDKKLIDLGIKNSSTWFKKKIESRDVIEALYTPIVKYSKIKETGEINDKYPPSMRLQVPFKNGEFTCNAFNSKKDLVDLKSINTRGMKMTSIIQCNGIWVAGGKFGCNFKIIQVKVDPKINIIDQYAFIEEDDEDIDNNTDNNGDNNADINADN